MGKRIPASKIIIYQVIIKLNDLIDDNYFYSHFSLNINNQRIPKDELSKYILFDNVIEKDGLDGLDAVVKNTGYKMLIPLIFRKKKNADKCIQYFNKKIKLSKLNRNTK